MRIALGLLASLLWTALVAWWLADHLGWQNLSALLRPELAGQSVAGFIAPLILIWLLVLLPRRHPVVSASVEAPVVAPVETRVPGAAVEAIRKASRDLNAVSMDLAALLASKPQRDSALKAYSQGDGEAFHRLVQEELKRQTPGQVRARLARAQADGLPETFILKFAGLMGELGQRDPGGRAAAGLRQGTLGHLDEALRALLQAAPHSLQRQS